MRAQMLPRRGVIEVELLRRYGRVPVGTRAVGWFEPTETPGPYMTHRYRIHLPIADDPRLVTTQVYFPWTHQPGEPYRYAVTYRGAGMIVTAADLFEKVLQDIVRDIEGMD